MVLYEITGTWIWGYYNHFLNEFFSIVGYEGVNQESLFVQQNLQKGFFPNVSTKKRKI